jgi:hypothetical protein
MQVSKSCLDDTTATITSLREVLREKGEEFMDHSIQTEYACKEKKSNCFIVNYRCLPSTIRFYHDSLAYISAASPNNDVNVLLFSYDIIHAI